MMCGLAGMPMVEGLAGNLKESNYSGGEYSQLYHKEGTMNKYRIMDKSITVLIYLAAFSLLVHIGKIGWYIGRMFFKTVGGE